MNYKMHLIIGLFLGSLFIFLVHFVFQEFSHNLFNLFNISISLGIIIIYSLLPDIDSRSSIISFILIGLSIIGLIMGYFLDIFLMYFSFLLLGFIFIVWLIMGHRGFTHSIFFGIIVSLPWMYVSWDYVALAFVCFYSHLAADSEFFKIV